jgi:hypothetical protein
LRVFLKSDDAAGHSAGPTALYGMWASETTDRTLRLNGTPRGRELNGSKAFCSGAGLIDRALVTVAAPEQRLVDVDLRANRSHMLIDYTAWIACAFAETRTATVEFVAAEVAPGAIIQGPR